MKKVGIVTIIDYYNFGNRLQNYAVSYLLNCHFGCKAITIEACVNSAEKENGVTSLKEWLALKLCYFPRFAEKHLNPQMIRWFNFSEWNKKWIPRMRIYSCDKLPAELNKDFDLFLSGSDQVWNYRIKNLRLDDNLLIFAEDKKKNSIAASFGIEAIPKELQLKYRKELSSFANISVREDTGAEIVKELIGRTVPVLLDPVMMLTGEEWMKIAKKPRVDISKPYVLKYFLGEEDSSIDKWAEEKGYIVLKLMDETVPELYSAGPGEFLSLLRNASLVCSDSFHCIAFSILFQRPFIAFERKGTENYMRSRLDTLLSKFGLLDRWYAKCMEEDYLNCNFSETEKVLEIERASFSRFVGDVLGQSTV